MNTPYLFILILSGIGILNTLYLSFHTITKTSVWCPFFPEHWCRKVQFSSWSRTFGMPNTFAGFALYSVIFIFTLSTLFGDDSRLWIKDLITVGFLFSVYFTFIQGFILRAFCTWCVLSAIDFLFLFLIRIFWL